MDCEAHPTSRMISSQHPELVISAKTLFPDEATPTGSRDFNPGCRDTIGATAGESKGCPLEKRKVASLAGVEGWGGVGSGGPWLHLRGPQGQSEEMNFLSKPGFGGPFTRRKHLPVAQLRK